jgi:cytochrome b subunit of formate dehydrogenase/nitrate/TMAO reductase-like tetraheme cytochrome c subunit
MRRLIFLILCLLTLAFAGAAQAQECLDCHGDPAATKDVNGKAVSVHVNGEQFGTSVHGSFGCADCHSDISGYPHDPAPQKVACENCHTETQEKWAKSIHAQARKDGNPRAATCTGCHGNIHYVVPQSDPKSRVNHARIPETCGGCHGVPVLMQGTGISTQTVQAYSKSVHGRAVAGGSQKAAVCTDCHNSHDVETPRSETSTINRFNIPQTCGKCHAGVSKEYQESVHGQSVARGNSRSPVCTDCHGIHTIKKTVDPNASATEKAIALTTCSDCHEGVKLAEEFGVRSGRVNTYKESYHGLANDLGSKFAANCASCHGVHGIRPSSDPKSTVHKNNLAATCGSCHPGAGENFIKGEIHLDIARSQDLAGKSIRWVRWIYLWLIFLTIGAMAIHNFLIWWRKAQEARKARNRVIERMNRNQRIQHFLLLSSFIILALTGFALKFPESWISALFGYSEAVRRIGHRLAAVVMLGVGIYHILYMVGTREGRQGVRDFLPRWKDVTDVIGALAYYLGLRSHRPAMARFTYVEKAEYWALIWGTIVMGVTGLMAWFNVETSQAVPRWWIEVAIAIHYYEAILASLAIVVWHFYHVIFDPDSYPMNWAWYDGKVSTEHYEHEHGLAYQEWLAEQRSKNPSFEEPAPEPGNDETDKG